MTVMLEYANGVRITPQQFRDKHRNEIYSGGVPPIALLEKHGLKVVHEPTPIYVAQSSIRTRRDSLLQDTDWIVIKAYERGENIPAEWELYRQALRDITAQEGFPYSVEWPTKPE